MVYDIYKPTQHPTTVVFMGLTTITGGPTKFHPKPGPVTKAKAKDPPPPQSLPPTDAEINRRHLVMTGSFFFWRKVWWETRKPHSF